MIGFAPASSDSAGRDNSTWPGTRTRLDVDLVALAGMESDALQQLGDTYGHPRKTTATQTGEILLIMDSLIF